MSKLNDQDIAHMKEEKYVYEWFAYECLLFPSFVVDGYVIDWKQTDEQ
jgi:hypothetical protein